MKLSIWPPSISGKKSWPTNRSITAPRPVNQDSDHRDDGPPTKQRRDLEYPPRSRQPRSKAADIREERLAGAPSSA